MINTHSHVQKKHRLSTYIFLFCILAFCLIETKASVKQEFFSPFKDPDRKSFGSIEGRLIGSYGEYRKSYKPGHLHAGADLKGYFKEMVYAIGYGQVQEIFRDFPHQTVIVKHNLPDGDLLFSVYTHVEEIKVSVGDWVNELTPLARLFSKDELKRANFGTPNHLHFEIRKSIDDEGRASYASMTRHELNTFCMDPMEFFKIYLEE